MHISTGEETDDLCVFIFAAALYVVIKTVTHMSCAEPVTLDHSDDEACAVKRVVAAGKKSAY
jgi:hypothetical protein